MPRAGLCWPASRDSLKEAGKTQPVPSLWLSGPAGGANDQRPLVDREIFGPDTANLGHTSRQNHGIQALSGGTQIIKCSLHQRSLG